jgi:hypothetical protein
MGPRFPRPMVATLERAQLILTIAVDAILEPLSALLCYDCTDNWSAMQNRQNQPCTSHIKAHYAGGP